MSLHVYTLPRLVEGTCGVCGAEGLHNHFDDEISHEPVDCAEQESTGEVVCHDCWLPLRVAEIEVRAWTQCESPQFRFDLWGKDDR